MTGKIDEDVSLAVDHRGWVAGVWFELAMERSGWASLYLGVDGGSRGVTQTLRLALSDVDDPLPEFANLAERAWRNDLPYSFAFDSEGPETRVSLLPGPADGQAVLDIRDVNAAAVYLVAVVEARQVGQALARALRREIANPDVADRWEAWYGVYASRRPRYTDGFGNAWLRDREEAFLRLADDPYGYGTWNATHYPST
jgi:hypothetical protein